MQRRLIQFKNPFGLLPERPYLGGADIGVVEILAGQRAYAMVRQVGRREDYYLHWRLGGSDHWSSPAPTRRAGRHFFLYTPARGHPFNPEGSPASNPGVGGGRLRPAIDGDTLGQCS